MSTTKDLETESITLSNGVILVLSESNWRISRKREKLETEAKESPLPDEEDQLFAETFYPLLAAPVIEVSNGILPTVIDCLEVLRDFDINNWYAVVKKLNPHWFTVIDKIVALAEEEERAALETKKAKMNLKNGEESVPSNSEQKIPERLSTN